MRHARNRSAQGRTPVAAGLLGSLAIVLAACGGTAAAPVATPAPVTSAPVNTVTGSPPASATPAPATPATPAPTGQVVATASPLLPAVFESPLYGYTIDLPEGSEVTAVKAATAPWDGVSAIASNGPMVDQFPRTGQRLAFILSAPTNLDLNAYAAAVHAKAVREHGCSEELTDERDFEIDGTPARVAASTCQGLLVYEATMVSRRHRSHREADHAAARSPRPREEVPRRLHVAPRTPHVQPVKEHSMHPIPALLLFPALLLAACGP